MEIEKKEILSTGRALVSLLRAELLDQTPVLPEKVSLEEVFQLAKRHGVENMSGHMAFSLANGPGKDLRDRWQKSMEANTAKNMVQLAERDRILDKLTGEHIDVLPLKGSRMIEMYPSPEQRQMADLDILVRSRDQERVRDCMKELDYEVERYDVTNEDTYRKMPFMHVEMHHDLFAKTSRFENLKEYYDDPWLRAVPDEENGFCYHLTREDFYLYLLAHFYKHFASGGCGIRNVMDIYVLLDRYGDSLDEDYLGNELRKLGLSEFRETMERLARQWFSPVFHEDPVDEEIEMTLFTSGAYGLRDNSRRAGLQRMEEKYSSKLLAKSAYIFSLMFPSYDRLIVKYPRFKGHRKILPLLWVYHIGYKILFDRERITGNIRVLRNPREDRRERGRKS